MYTNFLNIPYPAKLDWLNFFIRAYLILSLIQLIKTIGENVLKKLFHIYSDGY